MYVCTYASLLFHLRNHHRPRTPRRGPPPRRAPAPPRLPPAVPRLRSPHVQAPLAPPRPGVHQTRHRYFSQHFDDRRLIAWVCRRRQAGGLLWGTAALTKLTTELESESRFTKDKNTEILRLRFQSGNGGKGGGGGKHGQKWTRAGTNFSRRTCASSSCRIPPSLTSCSDLRDSSASSSRFPPSPCSTASDSVPGSPGAAVTAAAANFYECAWGKRQRTEISGCEKASNATWCVEDRTRPVSFCVYAAKSGVAWEAAILFNSMYVERRSMYVRNGGKT